MSRFPKLAENNKDSCRKIQISRQAGSHIVLHKFIEGRKIVTVVPRHREVKIGTIFGILSLAEIRKEDFLKNL